MSIQKNRLLMEAQIKRLRGEVNENYSLEDIQYIQGIKKFRKGYAFKDKKTLISKHKDLGLEVTEEPKKNPSGHNSAIRIGRIDHMYSDNSKYLILYFDKNDMLTDWKYVG